MLNIFLDHAPKFLRSTADDRSYLRSTSNDDVEVSVRTVVVPIHPNLHTERDNMATALKI
jgi:hypothetical protein